MIEIELDRGSGVAPYRQIVQQVHAAVQLGQLVPGEQLPTTDELVARLGVNRNTVGKAYHELRAAGLVTMTPGRGTFVAATVPVTREASPRLRRGLERWVDEAHDAGLDDESIRALVARSLHHAA